MVAGKAVEFGVLRPDQALLTLSSLRAASQPIHAFLKLNCLAHAPLTHP